MAKRKKAARIDLPTAMLLAEEDLAAMRPALAVAPELVVQTLARARKRRARKSARKKVKKAVKSSAKKTRKSVAKKHRSPQRRGKLPKGRGEYNSTA
jgi:hypothetical protein